MCERRWLSSQTRVVAYLEVSDGLLAIDAQSHLVGRVVALVEGHQGVAHTRLVQGLQVTSAELVELGVCITALLECRGRVGGKVSVQSNDGFGRLDPPNLEHLEQPPSIGLQVLFVLRVHRVHLTLGGICSQW